MICAAGCNSSGKSGSVMKDSLSFDTLPSVISCGEYSFEITDVSFSQTKTDSSYTGYIIVAFDRSALSDDDVFDLFYSKEDRYTEKMDVNAYLSGSDSESIDCIGSNYDDQYVYFAFQTNTQEDPLSNSRFSIQIVSAPDGNILDDSTIYYYYRFQLSDDEDYSSTTLDRNEYTALSRIIDQNEVDKAWASSQWTVEHFVDEFGDETENMYVRSKMISGYFSNTATSHSELTVYVYYEKGDYIKFRLLEYGNHKATHLSSDKITLRFKIDGETYSMTLKGGSDLSGDVYTSATMNEYDKKDFSILKDALLSGEVFPCYIKIGNSSEYHFTVDGLGFALALDEIGIS